MSVTNYSKDALFHSIENNRELYIKTSQDIHANPEIGNEEVYASEKHVEILKKAGFEVTTAVAGHETSFYAVKESGQDGPTVAFLAEYDALPGIGHACGHNIIGTTSVAAGIALAEALPDTGGRVVVLGTPAEEGGPNGSAKGSFVKHGFLKEVDVALMLHPAGKTALTSETLAVDPLDFHFYGKPAHAAGSPENGINALDAVIQLFNGINALRQQLPSDVRIHGIITHGGDAPNIIPEYASARFYIRAETWSKTEEVSTKVRAVADGAALATGATVKIERFQNEVKDFVLNSVLDQTLHEELEALGETVHTEKRKGKGSTDAGNISYEVPTAHGYIKIGPDDLVAHTVEFREAAKSEQGNQALITGAKSLTSTGYRLLTDSELLHRVRKEYEQAIAEKK
ncbi:amidohydrolase [Alkalihalobacillus alcalophilus ATCC 27647 = CGMCC 1.3604]|uniref:Peptidase M20 domain-containing protein 2 n=1 Tax=Alkalihalobacillus alcalophilus ATCC 27647 = CGMCC 1.3604 TaxID=1218173 RepID=A0A094XFF0_ALKAL|nr:M20 family metallopeptidase [Alkalihalobacillus alcalophilus]KGA97515.1 amidohydrolase [Alkalihalobacillus alcalophilus ATCC 27647 = CGMCC 1.3604]MED1560766.1 M20 family metallopeptidase [Alkalihalobacillus alcalophilus]THG91917.1 amidohydrolase [Alkalihalobacillus alcalophilus ATCC 27647 = CGMCC 1.3604]